jgi:hypothetical protein
MNNQGLAKHLTENLLDLEGKAHGQDLALSKCRHRRGALLSFLMQPGPGTGAGATG